MHEQIFNNFLQVLKECCLNWIFCITLIQCWETISKLIFLKLLFSKKFIIPKKHAQPFPECTFRSDDISLFCFVASGEHKLKKFAKVLTFYKHTCVALEKLCVHANNIINQHRIFINAVLFLEMMTQCNITHIFIKEKQVFMIFFLIWKLFDLNLSQICIRTKRMYFERSNYLAA